VAGVPVHDGVHGEFRERHFRQARFRQALAAVAHEDAERGEFGRVRREAQFQGVVPHAIHLPFRSVLQQHDREVVVDRPAGHRLLQQLQAVRGRERARQHLRDPFVLEQFQLAVPAGALRLAQPVAVQAHQVARLDPAGQHRVAFQLEGPERRRRRPQGVHRAVRAPDQDRRVPHAQVPERAVAFQVDHGQRGQHPGVLQLRVQRLRDGRAHVLVLDGEAQAAHEHPREQRGRDALAAHVAHHDPRPQRDVKVSAHLRRRLRPRAEPVPERFRQGRRDEVPPDAGRERPVVLLHLLPEPLLTRVDRFERRDDQVAERLREPRVARTEGRVLVPERHPAARERHAQERRRARQVPHRQFKGVRVGPRLGVQPRRNRSHPAARERQGEAARAHQVLRVRDQVQQVRHAGRLERAVHRLLQEHQLVVTVRQGCQRRLQRLIERFGHCGLPGTRIGRIASRPVSSRISRTGS